MIKKLFTLCFIFLAFTTLYAQKITRLELNQNKSKLLREQVVAPKILNNKIILNETINYIDIFEKQTKEGLYIQLNGSGLIKTFREGQPDLPVLTRMIDIPLNKKAEVRVISYEEEIVELKQHNISEQIVPAQPSLSKSDDPDKVPFYKDKQIYNTNKFFKRDIIQFQDQGYLRNKHLGYLEISPFEYNPVTNTIKVINNIQIEISFIDDSQAKVINPQTLSSPYFDNIINTVNKVDESKALIEGPVKYVIVSDRMFEETLQPFILWKTQKGFNVIEAYTDEIGTTKEAIKTYLQDLYLNPDDGISPTFLLLVGDIAQIPAFTGTAGSHVTDLYYAEYTGDRLPELFYGRFSATSVEQLQPQIDKTLEVEKYEMPDPSYLNNVVLVAGVDEGSAPTYGNGFVYYAAKYYINSENGIDAMNYFYPESGSSDEQIRADISGGVALANYTAHCSSGGWADPTFVNSNVASMTNAHMYPLMIGNCCLSNKFDDASCFGETLLRAAEKGAVGYIGGSNNTYWDEDFYWGIGLAEISSQPTYENSRLGSYDRFFHLNGESKEDWYITQGQMIVAGNLAVEESSSGRKIYYWEIYHLMGDPSLTPFVKIPENLSASFNTDIYLRSTNYQVFTEEGAYVALSRDSVLLDAQLAGENGIVTFTFDPVDDTSDFLLVITKQNRKPIISVINTKETQSPQIELEQYTIRNSKGEIIEQANFSDTIYFDVKLKNISDTYKAFDVTAKLASYDTNIVIIDNEDLFGNLESLKDSLKNEIFAVQLKNTFNDQQQLTFNLKLMAKDNLANEYSWVNKISIKVNAPSLEITDLLVSETLGNANDTIDPGETADIRVVISNKGSAPIKGLGLDAVLLGNSGSIIVFNKSQESNINIDANATDTVNLTITASISSEAGNIAYINLLCKDNLYNSYTVSADKELVIGTIPVVLISKHGNVITDYAYFYDSGGKDNTYSANENDTITFTAKDLNKFLSVKFLSFDSEPQGSGCYDYMEVYDGKNTSAPIIGNYCSSNVPKTIVSTNTDKALTFLFYSDYSVNYSGWEAIVRSVNGYRYQLKVKNNSGPIEGANVTFNNVTKTTGVDGIVVFENIPEGINIPLVIKAAGYVNYNGNVDLLEDLSEEITLNNSFSEITFIVKDKLTGNRIENARIEFLNQVVYTDSNGEYVFSQIEYGLNKEYKVSKNTYEDYLAKTDVEYSKSITILLDQPSYDVQFTVYDSDKHPITDADVSFNDEQKTTNTDGMVIFNQVYPAENIPLTVSKEGYYDVDTTITVEAQNKSVDIKLALVTSIPKTNIMNMKIYPNPTTGLFSIELGENRNNYLISIYDILGTLVYENNVSGNKHTVDLSSKAKGIYFISVKSGDLQITSRRLLIK